jgi:hypothetical protein
MARELENMGLTGSNGKESTLLKGTTELILREGPRLAPFGERGEEDPHPASPTGRGESAGSPKGKRRKKLQPPLSREAVARFLEAARPHVEWLERVHQQLVLDYEQSCREQIRLRTVVKPNYVRLEIEMRPGKPEQRCLDLAQQLKARLNHMREALERDRSFFGEAAESKNGR